MLFCKRVSFGETTFPRFRNQRATILQSNSTISRPKKDSTTEVLSTRQAKCQLQSSPYIEWWISTYTIQIRHPSEWVLKVVTDLIIGICILFVILKVRESRNLWVLGDRSWRCSKPYRSRDPRDPRVMFVVNIPWSSMIYSPYVAWLALFLLHIAPSRRGKSVRDGVPEQSDSTD